MEKTLQNTRNEHKKSLVIGESQKSWHMEKVQVRDIRINRREVTRERPGTVPMDVPEKAKDGKGHHQPRSEETSMELKDSSLGRKAHPKQRPHMHSS